ncbi:MAG: L-rhamnose/proton symporter RhaT, partial [Opitutaceae bacterium]
MITPNPIIGTGLHAIGGISAASCYLPNTQTRKWSWGTFWLVQSLFAWIIMPLVVGWLTVPGYFQILIDAPPKPFWAAFLLGAVYGFGGMSFGKAIKHIGYSLTYTLAIGISAVLGTIFPLMIFGGLGDFFNKPGGGIVLSGMILSFVGVIICGWAGFQKEKDLDASNVGKVGFNMTIGLLLTIVAGVLSGVFNLSLEYGKPIADMAAQNGAGHFEGNAKMIVSTSGCFVV